jgi:hypothetical protein
MMVDSEVAERCRKLCKLVQQVRLLATEHPVDFFIKGLWEEVLPAEWRSSLLGMDDETLLGLGSPQDDSRSLSSKRSDTKGDEKEERLAQTTRLASPGYSADANAPQTIQGQIPLSEFIREAGSAVLSRGCASIAHQSQQPTEENIPSPPQQLGTSKKKAHEIDLMANLVEKIVRHCKIDCVVDLGSGKGYLAEELALRGLKVVAIDSNPLNLKGAIKRHRLLTRESKRRGPLRKSERDNGRATSEGGLRVAGSSPVEASKEVDPERAEGQKVRGDFPPI